MGAETRGGTLCSAETRCSSAKTCLLGSFYRELLSHQEYAKITSVDSSQPSVTLDEMHNLERLATAGQMAAERPAFFDACIFEAAHLELDEPLARKVKGHV